MAHQNSNSYASSALSAILKEFDFNLVYKIAEIGKDSREQRQILLIQHKQIIDGLSQDIYP